jgi:hypothetical protein
MKKKLSLSEMREKIKAKRAVEATGSVTTHPLEVKDAPATTQKKQRGMKEILAERREESQRRAVAFAKRRQAEAQAATEVSASESYESDVDDKAEQGSANVCTESTDGAFDDELCESDAYDQPRKSDAFDRSGESDAEAGGEETTRRPKKATAALSTRQKPYPVHAFGKWDAAIRLIAKAVQVDLEMVGSSLIGVLSALAQAIINVSVKQYDAGRPVSVNMFVIASSGERKSSTIEAIVSAVRAALVRATDTRRNMIIQDVTVDGMVVGLLERCPSQFLLALEGASLLGGHAMSKDNLSRFLGNVSSLFSGEPISRTRVEEHHYAIGRLSVLLFSQPIVAMDFLSSDMIMQQGLGNRFMYSTPPSLMGTRLYADVELENDPVYTQFCDQLAALASLEWKISADTGGMDVRTVRMSPEAKKIWVAFYNSAELSAKAGGDAEAHEGYVTRFPEQVMRLAALLAMLDDPNVEHISEQVMERAVALGSYYLTSALDAFKVMPANKDEMDAKTLLDWMINKLDELDIDAIPVRMMYKDGPRCARPSKRTKELLALLMARGEVRKYTQPIHYGDGKNSLDNYAVTGM